MYQWSKAIHSYTLYWLWHLKNGSWTGPQNEGGKVFIPNAIDASSCWLICYNFTPAYHQSPSQYPGTPLVPTPLDTFHHLYHHPIIDPLITPLDRYHTCPITPWSPIMIALPCIASHSLAQHWTASHCLAQPPYLWLILISYLWLILTLSTLDSLSANHSSTPSTYLLSLPWSIYSG